MNTTPSKPVKDESPENMNLPDWLKEGVIVFDWCYYRGEKCFAVLNWEESERRQKPVIDIAYCATKELNGIYLKQRIYNKNFTHVK